MCPDDVSGQIPQKVGHSFCPPFRYKFARDRDRFPSINTVVVAVYQRHPLQYIAGAPERLKGSCDRRSGKYRRPLFNDRQLFVSLIDRQPDPVSDASASTCQFHCASPWCKPSTRRNNPMRSLLPPCRMHDPVMCRFEPLLQFSPSLAVLCHGYIAVKTPCPAASRGTDWRSPHPIPRLF